jgi:hypothetical protein
LWEGGGGCQQLLCGAPRTEPCKKHRLLGRRLYVTDNDDDEDDDDDAEDDDDIDDVDDNDGERDGCFFFFSQYGGAKRKYHYSGQYMHIGKRRRTQDVVCRQ